jgi:hypothetical protein
LTGAYAARPELADLVDVAVLVTLLCDDVRRARLAVREGKASMRAWHALWDAAEDFYFADVCPPEVFDLLVTAS